MIKLRGTFLKIYKSLILILFFNTVHNSMATGSVSGHCDKGLLEIFKKHTAADAASKNGLPDGALILRNPVLLDIEALLSAKSKKLETLKTELEAIQASLAQTLETIVEIVPPHLNPEQNGMRGFRLRQRVPQNFNGLMDMFRNLSLQTLSLQVLAKTFSNLLLAPDKNKTLLTALDIEKFSKSFDEIELAKTSLGIQLQRIKTILLPIFTTNLTGQAVQDFRAVNTMMLDREEVLGRLIYQTEILSQNMAETLERFHTSFSEKIDQSDVLSLAIGNLFSSRASTKEKINSHVRRIKGYGMNVEDQNLETEFPIFLVDEILKKIDLFDGEIQKLSGAGSANEALTDKQIEVFLASEDAGIFPKFSKTFSERVSQVTDSDLRETLQQLLATLEKEKKLIFKFVTSTRRSDSFKKFRRLGRLSGDLLDVTGMIENAAPFTSSSARDPRDSVANRKFLVSFTLVTLAGGGGIYYLLSSVFAND